MSDVALILKKERGRQLMRPYLILADNILDCVVEALDEVLDALILFYDLLKRGVESLTVFIARYRLRGPRCRRRVSGGIMS
jgi:hypothetical protein